MDNKPIPIKHTKKLFGVDFRLTIKSGSAAYQGERQVSATEFEAYKGGSLSLSKVVFNSLLDVFTEHANAKIDKLTFEMTPFYIDAVCLESLPQEPPKDD